VQFDSGTHSTQGAHLSYTGSNQNISTFISANKETSKGFRDNSAFDNQNALADFSIAGTNAIYGLKLHASDEELELPGELDEATYNENPKASSPPTEFLDENRAAGEFYVEHEQFAAEAAYRNRNQHSFVFGNVDSDMKTRSFTPRYKSKFRQLSLTIGGDFYKSNLDVSADFTTAFNKSSLERKDAALYVSGTINMPTQTSINLGIRRQRVDINIDNADVLGASQSSEQKTDLATAWDITLNQRINSAMRVYIRYAEGMRFPVLDEMWSYFDGSINILDTQSSQHIETGGSIQLDNSTRLSVSAFLMDIEKEIGFDVATFSNVNFDDTRHVGIDLSLQTAVSPWWNLNAGANWREARFTSAPYEDNNIPEIPSWRASLNQTFNLNSNQHVGLDVIYTGKRYFADDFDNQGKKMKGYTILNAYYKKTIGDWFFKLNINNLADRKAADFGVYRGFSANPYYYYPLPERTLLVSIGASIQ
jgi:iron complex outermembrane receptor protein